jgi:hypothetical protein
VIWLAAIAGLSIFILGAIVLKMLAAGREMRRLLAPRIRLVAPPKEPAPKDEDEVYLAGPKFASSDGGTP